MNPRTTNLLICVLALVLAALAASPTTAAIAVRPVAPLSEEAPADLFAQFAAELLEDCDLGASLTGPAPFPPTPSQEEDDRPATLQQLEDFLAALPAGCQPSSVSSSSSTGSGPCAIPAATSSLPHAGLVVSLLEDSEPSFANPPPGGPLRPPRRPVAS